MAGSGRHSVLHPISLVERDTGITKDTLRIWERRYGFPLPERNEKGERLYPDEQVARLVTIRKLLDHGMRPGKVVPLGETELQRYLVDKIQEVYRTQGVAINDKHIEVMVRQMMRLVKVVDPGDTDALAGADRYRGLFRMPICDGRATALHSQHDQEDS